jgi:hypothetical protein
MVPVLLLLAALAIGVLIAVVLSSGGSGRQSAAPPKRHGAASTAKTPGHGKTSTPATSGSTHSTQAGSTPAASTPAASTSTPSTSTATTTASPSGGGVTSGSGSSGGAPAGAVQAFYQAASQHRYAAAWALADPNVRSQLGGYSAFQNQMSSVRSITFHKAQVVGGSSSDTATVAVQTTSVQTSGTQQCAGTVRTIRSGQSWMLDHISINCS